MLPSAECCLHRLWEQLAGYCKGKQLLRQWQRALKGERARWTPALYAAVLPRSEEMGMSASIAATAAGLS